MAGLALAAACATVPRGPVVAPAPPGEPLAAGFAALAARRYDLAAARFAEAGTQYPPLADYAYYFRSRSVARAGRTEEAVQIAQQMVTLHPDSVWAGPGWLLIGEQARATGDLTAARGALGAARAALAEGSTGWARAGLALADVERARGDARTALVLAEEIRHKSPRDLAARRARRLVTRLRAAHPDLPPPDQVEEAEQLLREGDVGAARTQAALVLASETRPSERARALWVRAQAERALGERDTAETTCLALAREHPGDPLAARALVAVATWRWNGDDDAGARRLFVEVTRRFPQNPKAPEAWYGIGRIDQEAGRYDDAFRAYSHLAERFPQATVAGEARWRAGWVRYLAADYRAAARWFADVAERDGAAPRAAAAYWRARALARLGQENEARERLARLADEHPMSYYAGLAEQRLGAGEPGTGRLETPPEPVFPGELSGAHAERAKLLSRLGFARLARRELDALVNDGVPPRALLEAYGAVGAPSAALRLARELESPDTPGPLRRYLYPLGYWEEVRAAAEAHGVDPLLVAALIRQESLFDPAAISPADARGLMQLMPATARTLTGGRSLPRTLLHDVHTNVALGVTLLARLLERYGGSRAKALAAYNAGVEAVAKWEGRYGDREPDEFVELISFRETRDYVKTVLRNYRLYRQLYAPAASDSTSSAGSPPNAPFDMTTITSPVVPEATR